MAEENDVECTHARLVHITNIEFGGEKKSTTYKCEGCNNLFTVNLQPLKPPIISFGVSNG